MGNEADVDGETDAGTRIAAGLDDNVGNTANGDDEGNCNNTSKGIAEDAGDGVAVADVG